MNGIERMVRMSRDHCFSIWYDPELKQYFSDNEKTENSLWICDADREITSEALVRMTNLMLTVTEEYRRKGYLK